MRKLCLVLSIISLACQQSRPKKVISNSEILFRKDLELSILNQEDTLISGLAIELADDPFERQTGLMYRQEMDSLEGMLFVFEQEAMRAFYMKNTYLSLDILYVDESKKIVDIIKNTNPLSEESLPSKKPAKYVLELRARAVEQWGLAIGNRLDF